MTGSIGLETMIASGPVSDSAAASRKVRRPLSAAGGGLVPSRRSVNDSPSAPATGVCGASLSITSRSTGKNVTSRRCLASPIAIWSVMFSALAEAVVGNGFGKGSRARTDAKRSAQSGSASVSAATGTEMLKRASSGMQVSEQTNQLAWPAMTTLVPSASVDGTSMSTGRRTSFSYP